jgi:hypothetical protein
MGEKAFQQLQQAGLPVDWLNQSSSSRNFDPSTPSTKLMTMHASKGLEFPVVFIPGVGYLPNRYNDVVDEARLLYVAMTRAIAPTFSSSDTSTSKYRCSAAIEAPAPGLSPSAAPRLIQPRHPDAPITVGTIPAQAQPCDAFRSAKS